MIKKLLFLILLIATVTTTIPLYPIHKKKSYVVRSPDRPESSIRHYKIPELEDVYQAIPIDKDVEAIEYFKKIKETELESRIPYQEAVRNVITPNTGQNSNQ